MSAINISVYKSDLFMFLLRIEGDEPKKIGMHLENGNIYAENENGEKWVLSVIDKGSSSTFFLHQTTIQKLIKLIELIENNFLNLKTDFKGSLSVEGVTINDENLF